MRLKSVFISQYKNLRNFSLEFDGSNFLDVFVGKNGSGKSNLFEALIEIFRHLHASRRSMAQCDFNYKLSYKVEEENISIEWQSGEFTFNGGIRKTSESVNLPDNILIYYSGHNDTVHALVRKYEDNFGKDVKDLSVGESRLFIGVGAQYKALLLAVLLLQEAENPARRYICKKLGIRSVGENIRLTLNRPRFADTRLMEILSTKTRKEAQIDGFDSRTHYWGALGIVRIFLEQLVSCIKGGFQHDDIYDRSKDQYVLNLSTELILKKLTLPNAIDMFRAFDNLRTVGMLGDIALPLVLEDGTISDLNSFSDGQFQSAYIYAIAELFKDTECLTLLDEPDAFLHPEWQFEFLEQVSEISEAATAKNHVLMISHSAVTLIPHDKSKIKFFDIKNRAANCYDLPKWIAIKKLSKNQIKYCEHEKLLSIINTIQIAHKPVLFTEGSTDPTILTVAWKRLFDEDMPFIPFYAFSCGYIKQLLTDNRIHNEMGGLPVFALFDFDEAFNQWNDLNGKEIETAPERGMIKKWRDGESYAFMLPVPNNPRIRAQVINPATAATFGGLSRCAIEHLFYGLQTTNAFFSDEPSPGGTSIVFHGDKTAFARNIVPTLPDSCFYPLKPMFDFIAAKCRELVPAAPLQVGVGS